ncbi:hypothetical protein Tco_0259838 [Tanacetum coccineum]
MLVRHGTSDSGPDISFDTPASPGYMYGLGLVGSTNVFSYISPLEVSRETIPHHVPPVPTLQRHPFYCTPHAAADVAIPNPTSKDLAASNPDAKVLAKDEASKKRKASTSGSAPKHVSKCTRSSTTQSSGNLTGDAIHKDFFLFTPGPYYVTYLEDGIVAGSYESVDSRLRSLQERCTAYQGLEPQVAGLKKQVFNLNDKVSSSDADFVKAKAKGKERKKKIKSLSMNLDQLTIKVDCLYSDLNHSRNSLVQKFLASDEFSRVQGELLSLAVNASFEQLPLNDAPPSFVASLEKNEEWINTMVDIVDEEMGNAAFEKLVELSNSGDIVVALSTGEKENGSPHPSDPIIASADVEDVVVSPSGV